MVQQTPQIANALLAAISARLVKVTAKALTLRPHIPKSVIFMPIGNQALSNDFIEQLQTTIGTKVGWRVVTLLDAEEAVRSNEAELDQWLQWVQEDSENVVLVVDNPTENLPWYKAAIANGDNVFLVGKMVSSAEDVPAITGLERAIFTDTLQANTQLVVVREEHAEPIKNTKMLLSERLVALHHHVALDRVEDFERLSRFVRGKAVEKCEQIFVESKTMNRMTVPIYCFICGLQRHGRILAELHLDQTELDEDGRFALLRKIET